MNKNYKMKHSIVQEKTNNNNRIIVMKILITILFRNNKIKS